jgi:hypothetical protein
MCLCVGIQLSPRLSLKQVSLAGRRTFPQRNFQTQYYSRVQWYTTPYRFLLTDIYFFLILSYNNVISSFVNDELEFVIKTIIMF